MTFFFHKNSPFMYIKDQKRFFFLYLSSNGQKILIPSRLEKTRISEFHPYLAKEMKLQKFDTNKQIESQEIRQPT